MTGLMIVTALVIVLVVALGPAHRRGANNSFSPADPSRDAGVDDADRRRIHAEVDAVAQRRTLRAPRLLEIAARGQGAIPLHRRRVNPKPGRDRRAA